MVGARTAAMAFNRLADLDYDRRNPRTAGRALVTGELTTRAALDHPPRRRRAPTSSPRGC